MIPDGFGDSITGFENPYRQADSNTPYLTVGHTPWSTSSPGAFAFPSHRVSTTATHFGTMEGRSLFLYPFLFTGVGPVRVLDPVHVLGHGLVLDVVVWVDLDWRFGWMCGAPKVALPHLRRLW